MPTQGSSNNTNTASVSAIGSEAGTTPAPVSHQQCSRRQWLFNAGRFLAAGGIATVAEMAFSGCAMTLEERKALAADYRRRAQLEKNEELRCSKMGLYKHAVKHKKNSDMWWKRAVNLDPTVEPLVVDTGKPGDNAGGKQGTTGGDQREDTSIPALDAKDDIRAFVQDPTPKDEQPSLRHSLRSILVSKKISDIKVVLSVPSIRASGRGTYVPDSVAFKHDSITSQEYLDDYSKEENFRKNIYKLFEREFHRQCFNVRNTFYTNTPGDYEIKAAKDAGAELIFVAEFQPVFNYARFFVDVNGINHSVQGDTLAVPCNQLELTAIRVADNSKCGSFILRHSVKMDTRPFYVNKNFYRFEIGQKYKRGLLWKAPNAEDTARIFAEKLSKIFNDVASDR